MHISFYTFVRQTVASVLVDDAVFFFGREAARCQRPLFTSRGNDRVNVSSPGSEACDSMNNKSHCKKFVKTLQC